MPDNALFADLPFGLISCGITPMIIDLVVGYSVNALSF